MIYHRIKTEADPLLLLLLPAHPVHWLLAYLWTGCCCSLVEGWVNKAAACRWDSLRWMALLQMHTPKSTHAHTVPKDGRMEGEDKNLHMDKLIGKITSGEKCLFVFNGQQGHWGGAAGVFDSALAEVKLGQKLGAILLWLTVSVCARGRKAEIRW